MDYKAILKLMRPHQYIKNFFIFAPLFFAFDFTQDKIWTTFLVFLAFCCIASAVYVFNDLLDVEQDRLHPKKKFRPIASNQVSQNQAFCLIGVLLIGGGGISILL